MESAGEMTAAAAGEETQRLSQGQSLLDQTLSQSAGQNHIQSGVMYAPVGHGSSGRASVPPSGVLDDELARLQEMTAVSKTHEEQPSLSSSSGAANSADPNGSGTMSTNEYGEESMLGDSGAVMPGEEDELVRRSVYVGNVDYGTTPQELQEHFNKCGKVVRVTIMVDKYSGHPKGFAYIEFGDQASANNALMLANSTLRGRQIKVSPKRKNIAGLSRGRGGGRGGRGRGMPPGAAFFGANIYGMSPFTHHVRGFGRGGGATSYAPRLRGRGAATAAMATPY